MTLHIVLGNGYMPAKELTAHLQDMRDRAQADNDPFWFLIEAKAEPTDTDRALIKWLTADKPNDVYFDAIGDKDSADKVYRTEAQEIHSATKLATKIVQLMDLAKAGGVDEDGEVIEPEGADLLALFFSDQEDAEEDRWLNDVISAVADAGYPVYALNDGMTLLEADGDGGESPDEDEAEDVVVDEVDDAEEPVAVTATVTFHTRDELLEMDLDDLKKIALELGIEVPPRSRKGTYADAILGEKEQVPEVELEFQQPHISLGTTTTSANVAYIDTMSDVMSGPAMVIVVHNGSVTSKLMTVAQAQALLSS